MNDLGKPHRRWLDAAMPDAATQRVDLERTRAAIDSRSPTRWRVAGLAVAGALAIAIAIVRREPVAEQPPPVAAPIDWGLRLALHVDGRPAESDVRIHIAVRREPTP